MLQVRDGRLADVTSLRSCVSWQCDVTLLAFAAARAPFCCVSGEALWRFWNTRNLLAAGALPRSRWESLQRYPRPISWWGGASFPLSQNPTPTVGPLSLWLRPFRPRPWPKVGGLSPPNMMGWICLCVDQSYSLGGYSNAASGYQHCSGLFADCCFCRNTVHVRRSSWRRWSRHTSRSSSRPSVCWWTTSRVCRWPRVAAETQNTHSTSSNDTASMSSRFHLARNLRLHVRAVMTRGPIYKISWDFLYDYLKFVVRSTYDSTYNVLRFFSGISWANITNIISDSLSISQVNCT